MKRFAPSGERPARESDSFRRLVKKEISVEEYVQGLERRVQERENGHEDTKGEPKNTAEQ